MYLPGTNERTSRVTGSRKLPRGSRLASRPSGSIKPDTKFVLSTPITRISLKRTLNPILDAVLANQSQPEKTTREKPLLSLIERSIPKRTRVPVQDCNGDADAAQRNPSSVWRAGSILKYDVGRRQDGDELYFVDNESTDELQGLGDIDGTA